MKPSIFNTEMVRAILDGRKTQTRRKAIIPKFCEVKSLGKDITEKSKTFGKTVAFFYDPKYPQFLEEIYSPYKVGDIIYVRETFVVVHRLDDEWLDEPRVYYKADNDGLAWVDDWDNEVRVPWKPSIYMPKEYARLFLRVKDVRIERLNEISYDDALAEGIERDFDSGNEWWLWKDYSTGKFEFEYDFRPEESFGTLWESIYGNGSFDNRYVWVIEFERISKEEDMSETAT